MWEFFRGLPGVFALLALAWVFSENRRGALKQGRLIVTALGLQLVVGLVVFRFPAGQNLFVWLDTAAVELLARAREGAVFLFGPLAVSPGEAESLGFILAFQALPTAIFFAALTALLHHVGILPLLIRWFAVLFRRSLGISGAESVVAASNLFVGVESALMIRPYLDRVPRATLAIILTVGMATIASTMLGLYVGILSPVFPTVAGHLLTANFLSAPAAVLFARLLVPTDGLAAAGEESRWVTGERDANWVQSITRGARDGLELAFGIAAVLVAFVGLVALVNAGCGVVGGWFGHPELRMQDLLQVVFAPLAWLIGVPWEEAGRVGGLLATRLVATEVPAYFELFGWMNDEEPLDRRTMLIATYALCGFAHLPSMGILAGGLSALIPNRSGEIGSLAPRCLLAATFACLLTGAIAGMLAGVGGAEGLD